jgi:hypothetical protein
MSRQKPIEKITHELEIEVILKILWALKDDDKFYFMTYGKEIISRLVKQEVRKKL